MVSRGFLLLLFATLAGSASGQEFSLLGSPITGFDYTFDDWAETVSPTSVRFTDNTPDGWGGAGIVLDNPLDLTGFSDGRLVVDFQTEQFNRADTFTIELFDDQDRTGKWTFGAGLDPIGTPQSRVSATTLNAPLSGVGDFQNLDLANITRWQVLGEFGSPGRFDMSFSSVVISNDTAAPAPYDGFEADAPWRAVAAQRIDAIRKADLAVSVVDATGAPLPGATVAVNQQEHEFGFGTAVQARRLGNNPQANPTYQQRIADWFNLVTVENNFKWPAWEGDWGPAFSRQTAGEALDWIESQGLEARGHVMVWPGASNLPNSLQALATAESLTPAQQAELRGRIAAHIADLSDFTRGRITAWDVVNEPRTNSDLMRLLDEGDGALADWFQQARDALPDAGLYLNEFNVLASAEGTDTFNQQLLESQVAALQAAGAPIDGVGLQGHFDEGSLTGPEQLWQIVDRYADLGLNVQVTEFDIGTDDEQLQAAYLRDFFTAMFAHEGVSDVIQWGFWEGAIFNPQRALFRQDWSAKPAGQAYLDLVFDEWWTEELLTAGDAGDALLRAFKGEHAIEAAFGDAANSANASLTDGGAALTIALDVLLGDYNGDGVVNAADYAVWRNALGQTVATPGLGADGDGDGVVGPGDYDVWLSRFGASLPAAASAVPEPTAAALLAVAAAMLAGRHPARG